ncbi:MAG: serine/threonine-protein kinase [Dissulfurispiraceae bacterium]
MARSSKNPSVFETSFSAYSIKGILGEGGAGRIFKCTDDAGERWAVKLLDPEKATRDKLKRFKNELVFCERNKHPNIVTVVDRGLYKDGAVSAPFYVMPVYDRSLRKLIDAGIKTDMVLPYFGQLLDGIEAAHLQKVVHRDIKPENILYDSANKRLLVCDFGIARFEEEELFTAVDTKDTDRLANFQYAAPEQRGRGLEVDHRADIYALGLILNEMFTGEVPYGTGYKTISSVALGCSYLDDLVSAMLRQTPSERPASIAVIKAELIGRKNEFITQQRLSELKATVIPVSDIDDPLIADPPKLVGVDYERGTLTLTLSTFVNPTWVRAFQNMGNYGSFAGYDPGQFQISGNKAVVSRVRDDSNFIQQLINYFKGWLPTANFKYKETIERQIRDAEENERKRLKQEIEERERRMQILKSVKI